jgi:hypothetical protein
MAIFQVADEYKEMNAIILLLPLLLLVAPAVSHGQQTTITAPQGTTINNTTVTVFQPRYLNGTWNFMNGVGNVSGSITFSNQDLCPTCKWDWQHKAFSGIFSGHPISGTYTWQYAPGGPGFVNDSYLSLKYNYHHINLLVMGNLTVINPAHMEWSRIGPINYDRHD